MIPTLDQSRVVNQQSEVLKRAASVLHPKLKKLLDPNIVDCWVRITLHIANGDLKYIHDADSKPGYVDALIQQEEPDNVQATLASALKTIRLRIADKVGHGWHGAIILLVTISGGQGTISSEADGVHRLG